MSIFPSLRSSVIRVRWDYFKFLCILAALCSTYPFSEKKTVSPSQRSKISEIQKISPVASQQLSALILTQKVPYNSCSSQTSFLIPRIFLFTVTSKNPDFFYKFLTISSTSSNNSSNYTPIGSLQGLNSTLPFAKIRSSHISSVTMKTHHHFLKLQPSILPKSPDRRILSPTPFSTLGITTISPIHIIRDQHMDPASGPKRKSSAADASQHDLVDATSSKLAPSSSITWVSIHHNINELEQYLWASLFFISSVPTFLNLGQHDIPGQQIIILQISQMVSTSLATRKLLVFNNRYIEALYAGQHEISRQQIISLHISKMISTSPRDRTGLTVFDASPVDTRTATQSRTGSLPPHNILVSNLQAVRAHTATLLTLTGDKPDSGHCDFDDSTFMPRTSTSIPSTCTPITVYHIIRPSQCDDRTGVTVFDASPADTSNTTQSRTVSLPSHNILMSNFRRNRFGVLQAVHAHTATLLTVTGDELDFGHCHFDDSTFMSRAQELPRHLTTWPGILVTTWLLFPDIRLLDALLLTAIPVVQADPPPVTSLSTPATTLPLPNLKSRTINLIHTLSSRTTPSPLALTSTSPFEGNSSPSPSGHTYSPVIHLYCNGDITHSISKDCTSRSVSWSPEIPPETHLPRLSQRTQSDGGHIGPVLLFLCAMLFHTVMFMHALHDMLLPNCYCNRLLKPPSFFCPQGPINSFFLLLVLASVVTINKHLDVRKNLTCSPTLSYDKGIAYS